MSRAPGGSFVRREAGLGADPSFIGGEIIDLDVQDDGSVLLAGLHTISVLPVDGPARTFAGGPGGSVGQTDYVDQSMPNPRPALGSPLPTVTGVTGQPDGTVIVLAVDSVLSVDGDGLLRTLASPASSADPATRLVRAAVRDGGSGSLLTDALPYGRDVLLYDSGGARVLRLDPAGDITLLAGGPVDKNGDPVRGVGVDPREQWGKKGDTGVALDEVLLPYGPTRTMSLLANGDLLLTANEGVVALGIPPAR